MQINSFSTTPVTLWRLFSPSLSLCLALINNVALESKKEFRIPRTVPMFSIFVGMCPYDGGVYRRWVGVWMRKIGMVHI